MLLCAAHTSAVIDMCLWQIRWLFCLLARKNVIGPPTSVGHASAVIDMCLWLIAHPLPRSQWEQGSTADNGELTVGVSSTASRLCRSCSYTIMHPKPIFGTPVAAHGSTVSATWMNGWKGLEAPPTFFIPIRNEKFAVRILSADDAVSRSWFSGSVVQHSDS